MKTNEEIARTLLLTFRFDVPEDSTREHAGLLIKSALDSKDTLITELREAIRNLVLDDVPHQYQGRLLELLK